MCNINCIFSLIKIFCTVLFISKSVVDLVLSISNMIACNDKYSEKGPAVSSHLKRFYIKENNLFIDHKKTIKFQNLNKNKIHLNKTGSSILRENFMKAISNIFQWRIIESYVKSFSEVEESNSDSHNVSFNQLIIVYLNIYSLRNKFEFLLDIGRGNIDILLISET